MALEVAAAAANSGVRTFCMMKHVGLNVAADPFVNSGVTGVNGGLVLAVADDPGMHSSQNEQDNRFYAKLSACRCSSPRTRRRPSPSMTADAFDLSERLGAPVMLRTTTRINHASAFVELGKINAPQNQGRF